MGDPTIDCVICLETCSTNTGKFLDCGHEFCEKCISEYLKYSITCPLDRQVQKEIFYFDKPGGELIKHMEIKTPNLSDPLNLSLGAEGFQIFLRFNNVLQNALNLITVPNVNGDQTAQRKLIVRNLGETQSASTPITVPNVNGAQTAQRKPVVRNLGATQSTSTPITVPNGNGAQTAQRKLIVRNLGESQSTSTPITVPNVNGAQTAQRKPVVRNLGESQSTSTPITVPNVNGAQTAQRKPVVRNLGATQCTSTPITVPNINGAQTAQRKLIVRNLGETQSASTPITVPNVNGAQTIRLSGNKRKLVVAKEDKLKNELHKTKQRKTTQKEGIKTPKPQAKASLLIEKSKTSEILKSRNIENKSKLKDQQSIFNYQHDTKRTKPHNMELLKKTERN